jgi:hypothetical protein
MNRVPVIILILFLASTTLHAQSEDDSLRFAESIWSMKKKAMILEQMHLTEAEKSAFWPVYESYSNAIQYLEMESLRLLSYTVKDKSLTDKKAVSLCEDLLVNDVLLARARRQYFRKFKKALSPAQAGRFMQLDSNFRTMLRLQIQQESPAFVSSLNRMYSRN